MECRKLVVRKPATDVQQVDPGGDRSRDRDGPAAPAEGCQLRAGLERPPGPRGGALRRAQLAQPALGDAGGLRKVGEEQPGVDDVGRGSRKRHAVTSWVSNRAAGSRARATCTKSSDAPERHRSRGSESAPYAGCERYRMPWRAARDQASTEKAAAADAYGKLPLGHAHPRYRRHQVSRASAS